MTTEHIALFDLPPDVRPIDTPILARWLQDCECASINVAVRLNRDGDATITMKVGRLVADRRTSIAARYLEVADAPHLVAAILAAAEIELGVSE